MQHQLKIIFILSLFLISSFFPQTIESINLAGNKNFSHSDYQEWIALQSGQTVFEGIKDTILNRIAFNLNQRGYFHYTFNSVKLDEIDEKNSVEINLELDENEPTYINKINLDRVNKIDSEFVYSEFNNFEGKILNKYELEDKKIKRISEYSIEYKGKK